MKTHALAAAFVLSISAPAFAGSISIPGLTTTGAASTTSGALVLTPNNTKFDSGAGYLNTALALGGGTNFSDVFTFTIAPPTTGQTANGFAFFLATTPTGIGLSNMNLGLTAASPLAVEFYDFGNSQNPSIGGGLYNSNLVAAIQGGSTVTSGNPTASYGSPGGVTSCVGKTPGANCLNNGDVWTADVSYLAGKLYVTVEDGTGTVYTVINGYAVALSGTFYTGFSGSTGGGTDSVTINTWSSSIPEPITIGMFGIGMAALGFARSRRQAV